MLVLVNITADTRTPEGNFYAGELRKVPGETAEMLINHGWATLHKVELDVHSARLGVKAETVTK